MKKNIIAALAAIVTTACHAQSINDRPNTHNEIVTRHAQTDRNDIAETASVESAANQAPANQQPQQFEISRAQMPARQLETDTDLRHDDYHEQIVRRHDGSHQFQFVSDTQPPVEPENSSANVNLVTFTLEQNGPLFHYKWSGGHLITGTVTVEQLALWLIVLGMLIGLAGVMLMGMLRRTLLSLFRKKDSEQNAAPEAITTATEMAASVPTPAAEVNDLEDSRDELETAPPAQTESLLRSIAVDTSRQAAAMEGLLHEWRGPACLR